MWTLPEASTGQDRRRAAPAIARPGARTSRTCGRRRQVHAPAPRRLAREHHRASEPVALHGDQRARSAAGAAGNGQHAGSWPAARRAARPWPAAARLPSACGVASVSSAICMIGCAAPSDVSDTRLAPAPVAGGSAPPSRPLSWSGSASSSGVPSSPCRANDAAPSTSRPPPRRDDERARRLELRRAVSIAASTLASTIASYAESASTCLRIPGDQRVAPRAAPPARRTCWRPARPCLFGRRRPPPVPGRRPGTLEEAVLESGRALDQQDPPWPRGPLHQHAARVVLGNGLTRQRRACRRCRPWPRLAEATRERRDAPACSPRPA